MADLRLIHFLPSQTLQGVSQSRTSQGAGAQSSPPSLASITPGTLLSGFIVNRDASGNPVLRTSSGDIAFETRFFLRIGSEITIRVEHSQQQTLAHILTIDGKPPELAQAASRLAQEPDVIVSRNLAPTAPQAQTEQAQQTSAATANAPKPFITVTGTLVSPAPGSELLPNQPPPGTQLTLKLTTLVPVASNPASPSMPSPGTASANQPTAPSTTTANAFSAYARAGGVAPLATGAPVAADPVATQPAAQPATATATPPSSTITVTAPMAATPAPPPSLPTAAASPALPPAYPAPALATSPAMLLQPGQSIAAVVIGSEPGGEAVLHTDAGVVRLQPGTALPVGSKLTLDITRILLPAATAPETGLARPAPVTELAQHWSSLQQIIGLLSARFNEAGLNFVQPNMPWLAGAHAMPQQTLMPPQTLPAGLLLFMTALRGSDFRNWLGEDNAKWLELRGQQALLKKAEGEFQLMARQFTEPPPNQWQTLFFPVAVAGEVQQARLFVKRDRKQSGQQGSGGLPDEDTRFIVELDLSQMGEIQMDGFVRRHDRQVQFDLIIRSHIPFSEEIQKDIAVLYSDAGELTGFRGSLVFQPVKEFPVHPLEEILGHAIETVIV